MSSLSGSEDEGRPQGLPVLLRGKRSLEECGRQVLMQTLTRACAALPSLWRGALAAALRKRPDESVLA